MNYTEEKNFFIEWNETSFDAQQSILFNTVNDVSTGWFSGWFSKECLLDDCEVVTYEWLKFKDYSDEESDIQAIYDKMAA